MDEGFQSFLSKCSEDLQSMLDSFFSNRTLLVTIHHAIWPITQDVLHQVFSPFGSVQKIIPFQTSVEVQFLIHFRCYGAIAAMSSLQGRNIYDGCCQMDIQLHDDVVLTDGELKQVSITEVSTAVECSDSLLEPTLVQGVMSTWLAETEHKPLLSGSNEGKLFDELSVITDMELDSFGDSTMGFPEPPRDKALIFKGCGHLTRGLLEPSPIQEVFSDSLRMNEEVDSYTTKVFEERFVRQGEDPMATRHIVKFVDVDDLCRFRLLLMERSQKLSVSMVEDSNVVIFKDSTVLSEGIMDHADSDDQTQVLVSDEPTDGFLFELPRDKVSIFEGRDDLQVGPMNIERVNAKLSHMIGESFIRKYQEVTDRVVHITRESDFQREYTSVVNSSELLETLDISTAVMDQLDETAVALAGLKEPIVTAKVNADKFTRLASKYDIDGYPTLKFFMHGVSMDYYGPRKADLLVQYLKKFVAPDVSVLSSDSAINDFVEAVGAFFPIYIGFGLNESMISNLALKYKKKVWFSVAKDFSEHVMVLYDFDKVPSLVALHPSYKQQSVFYGPFEDKFLGNFIKQNLLPLVVPLNHETLKLLKDEERKIVSDSQSLHDANECENLVDWLTVRKTKVEKVGQKTAQKGKIILTDLERWQKGVVNSNVFGATKDVTMQGQQASKPIPLILVKHADYHVLLGLNFQFLFKTEEDKKVIEQLVTTSELHKFGIIGRVVGNKDLCLGTFNTQEEAIEAYDIVAIELLGVNVVSNFDITKYDVDRNMASNAMFFRELARQNNEANAYSAPTPTYGEIIQPEGNNENGLDWNMTLCLSSQQPSTVCITVEPLELKSASIGNYRNPTFSIALQDFIGVDLVNYMQPMVIEKVWAVEPKLSWMNANELIESGKLLPTIMKDLLLWWEPNVAKKKKSIGRCLVESLEEIPSPYFIFKGSHGIPLLILEDKDSFEREVL